MKTVTREERAAVEKQLRENQEAIERAMAQSRRIRRVLRDSQRVEREAIPKLKKAGYIR